MTASNHCRRLLQITALLSFLALCAPHTTDALSDTAHNKRATAGVVVRIGLIRLFGHVGQVSVAAPPGARLTGTGDAVSARGPATWIFSCDPDGRVVVRQDGISILTDRVVRVCPPDDETSLAVALYDGARGDGSGVGRGHAGREQRYRGVLEIGVRSPDGAGVLSIVNEIALESYLRGVIAMEMPSSAPAEALRAQAVAARTYALKSRGKYRTAGYDLTDTTASQVYGGVNGERATTDAAVQETAGLVLTRGDQLIWADYYDDCGGVTSPGDGEGDFPPSVRDAPGDGAADYCARGTYHTWTLKVGKEDLSRVLKIGGQAGPAVLKSLEATQTDESGRVRRVQFVGVDGTQGEITGERLRAGVGYDRLKSTLFTVTQDADGGFVFQGRGYGHGHGLCQWGAMGMAAAPYNRSFREILDHYFPGASIVAFAEPSSKTVASGSRNGSR